MLATEHFRTYRAAKFSCIFLRCHCLTMSALDSINIVVLWLPPHKWVLKSRMVRHNATMTTFSSHCTSQRQTPPFGEDNLFTYMPPYSTCPVRAMYNYDNMVTTKQPHYLVTSADLCLPFTLFTSATYHNIASTLISGRLIIIPLCIPRLQNLGSHHSSWANTVVN